MVDRASRRWRGSTGPTGGASASTGSAVPPGGRPGLEQQLSYYREFLDWSAKGRAPSR